MALLASRLAAVRGYRTTLLFDPAPTNVFLALGSGNEGNPGLLTLLQQEAGWLSAGREKGEYPHPEPTSSRRQSCLYMGKTHRLLGSVVPSEGLSPDEEKRFFPGLRPLFLSVLPELERRMELCYRVTASFVPWQRRILDWIFEPQRKKEILPRVIKKQTAGFMAPWSALLGDLRSFPGLALQDAGSPELLRVFSHLALNRIRQIDGLKDLAGADLPDSPDPLGRKTEVWDGIPLRLERKGHRGKMTVRPVTEGQRPVEVYDRVLALTGMPEVPLIEATCSIDLAALPVHWPASLLLPDPSSFLILPSLFQGETSGTARLLTIRPAGNRDLDLEKECARWNNQALSPFMVPGSIRISPEPPPIFLSEAGSRLFGGLHRKTSFLNEQGHYTVMTDPTRLAILSEDWLADLSMALPNRVPPP